MDCVADDFVWSSADVLDVKDNVEKFGVEEVLGGANLFAEDLDKLNGTHTAV